MPTKKGPIVTRWCLEVDDNGHLYVGGDVMLSLAYDEWIRRGNDKLLLQVLEHCKGQPPMTVT